MTIAGKNEAAAEMITVRKLGSSENFSYSLEEFIDQIVKEASPK